MFSSARHLCLSSIPECTELCTYALQGAAPNALSRVDHPRMIRYVDHLLPVDALKPRQGVFWGAWGHRAHRDGKTWFHRLAHRQSGICLTLRLHYAIPGAATLRNVQNWDDVCRSGLLHLERLKTGLQQDVKAFLLDRIEARHGRQVRQQQEGARLSELALQWPDLVQDLLSGPLDLGASVEAHLQMVVHPVRLPGIETPVLIASARMEASRIVSVLADSDDFRAVMS